MAYIYDDSHEYTGNPATFTDSHGTSDISGVSVPFSPIQDLHGYDSPWPGGGGKNKLPSANSISSPSSLTVTNENGQYVLNGSVANGDSIYFRHDTITIENGFVFACGNSFVNAILYFVNGTTQVDYFTLSPVNRVINTSQMSTMYGKPFNLIRIRFSEDRTFTNAIFSPMVVIDGADTTTFAPYSNICPISGRTGVNVYRTGVNVWDGSIVTGKRINSSTGNADNASSYSCSDFVKVLPNTAYYFKDVCGNTYCSGCWYDSDKQRITTFTLGNGSKVSGTETAPDTARYVRFNVYNNQGYGETCINYPSTDHDYHAYTGNTYAVDWTTEAGTVYGGTVDVVTGVLTVDRAMVDLGTLNWTYVSNKYFQSGDLIGLIKTTRQSVPNTAISSMYRMVAWSDTNTKSGDLAVNADGRLSCINSNYTNATSFKTAMSGVQFVYELATPLTYQLAPKSIGVIKNSVNNLWASNNESITVTVSDILYGFQGWLIKVGNPLVEIPTTMIEAASYKVTPDQRMEESAERDTTGYLWRDTVRNTPTKIEFNTPPTNNTDVSNLNSILRTAFTVTAQRRLPVAFYDPEEDCYKTCDAYMPDVEYPMHLIDPSAKTVLYDSIRYAFIGY